MQANQLQEWFVAFAATFSVWVETFCSFFSILNQRLKWPKLSEWFLTKLIYCNAQTTERINKKQTVFAQGFSYFENFLVVKFT